MHTKAAEFKAGILVLAGLVGLVVFLYFAGGEVKPWASHHTYDLRFAPGSLAPRKGDAVYMNGVAIGSVEAVGQRQEQRAGAREIFVQARIRCSASQALPVGTRGEIVANIAGVPELKLVPPDPIPPENLPDGATLPAAEGAGVESVLRSIEQALSGFGETTDKFGTVAEAAEATLTEARLFLEEARAKLAALDTATLNDNVQGFVRELREGFQTVSGQVTETLAKIDRAAANAERFTGDGAKLVGEVSEAVAAIRADAEKLLATAQGAAEKADRILAKAEPQVDTFLAAVTQAATEVEALAKEFSGLGPQASSILKDFGIDVDEMMAYLVDAARNVYDVSEDLRANPHKLLNEPEPRQVAFQNLRQASQNYIRAMRDLDKTSERLKALLDAEVVDTPEMRARIEEASSEFERALERYKDDEQRWTELFRTARPR